VIVFFRRDIAPVVEKLKATFSTFEHTRKTPADPRAFAYESEHLIFGISPLMYPSGWTALPERPTTFEMQVRTLAMHAWRSRSTTSPTSRTSSFSEEETRKVAWAASTAWGVHSIFEEVLASLEDRGPGNDADGPARP
jgi:ppGpp synthetase/RelA/SpoT-type nucleotidyltranferase